MLLKRAAITAALVIGLSAGAADAAVLYSNGPADNQTNAWVVAPGFEVAESFVLSSASALTGADISAWMDPNAVVTNVDWAILDGMPGSGSVLAAGSSTATNSSGFMNQYDWWVRTVSFDLPNINLGAGTYWLELKDLVTTSGNQALWDINGGPSSAWQVSLGDVTSCPGGVPAANNRCSTSFEILGGPPTVAEPNSALVLMSALALLGFGFSGRLVRRKF